MARSDIEAIAQEVAEEYRAKTEAAVGRIEKELEKEIQKIIKKAMIDNYYKGYTPKMYIRTNQLPKSVAPYIEPIKTNMGYDIAFGIETESPYGAEVMDHSAHKVKVTWKRKRTGETVTKTYLYIRDNVNEEQIFENFLDGIHPNVGPAGTTNVGDTASTELDNLLNSKIDGILESELSKIK